VIQPLGRVTAMTNLFGHIDDETLAPDDAPAPLGPFAGVALENSLDRELDYAIPEKLIDYLHIGQRVRVPLGRGNRPQFGYVVSLHDTTTYPKIKPLLGIDDERVLINPQLMQLARWMSRYYVAPLGTVIDSIIPSAVKKKTGIAYSQMVRLVMNREQVQTTLEQTKAPKRRAILARLLQVEPGQAVEINRLAGESGSTVPTIRKLRTMGVISITPEIDLPKFESGDEPNPELQRDITLNEHQQRVFDDLLPRVQAGGFSVNLLHGVTGSGKTEIYLQCIRQVVEQGRQAIVLVPEIALTPQTVRRFTARFQHVSILHSGLTATDRHRHWQLISSGRAQVIVGARSAVFAPAPNLGMIVVDEEHEASYKQDQIPRYHARDVAVKRAQIEDIPILLGSATPSLESWSRVSDEATKRRSDEGERASDEATKRQSDEREVRSAPSPSSLATYHLLSLPTRVRNLQMPHVELVDMITERRMTKGIHLIGQRLEHLLRVTLEKKQQAILLLNRRGYSNFVFCSSCQTPLSCKYCDATMTYHRSAGQGGVGASHDASLHTGQLHCHYCLAVQPLPPVCPQCKHKLSLFGLGTQRVEEELTRKFPDMTFARVDSDTMRSSKDYEALLARFAKGEIQVMLGTQMIAKGLDYPNVTLVGVISGDTALALPDFRAAERTFQLITQVAGRAGRGDVPGRVVLQTFLPDDPTIQAALKGDYVGWAAQELKHRKEVGHPPFARMVRIILRDQEEEKLHKLADEIAEQLNESLAAELQKDPSMQVRVRGPMPCAIAKIAGHFRHQLVLISPRASALQKVLANLRDKGSLTKTDRVAVDVDPVSLL
jgi:primosomal protein N' (replication factor Y) (superfamily II helicase)